MAKVIGKKVFTVLRSNKLFSLTFVNKGNNFIYGDFLELFSRNNFILRHLSKETYPNEKFLWISPQTSPNSPNIQDAAGSSVIRCTL